MYTKHSYYWFKPKKVGVFAIYYPTNFPGWVVTLSCLFYLFYFVSIASQISSNISSYIYWFLPRAIIVLIVYDLFCFRAGEYPYWWRK